MKRLSITILALILSLYAIADSSGECGYNLRWTYKEATKTLTIYGSGDMYPQNYSTVPFCIRTRNIDSHKSPSVRHD